MQKKDWKFSAEVSRFPFTLNIHFYSHWLGVPETRSVVVSLTVIVTWRPDFGFPSAPSCGTAYTGDALRALLNSSSKLSTDGRWIWSRMSCDNTGLDALFTGGAAFDWLTSTKCLFCVSGEKSVRKVNRNKPQSEMLSDSRFFSIPLP